MGARITKAGLAVVVAAAVYGCAGRAAAPPTLDAEVAAAARDDYLRSCAQCHGADGRGGAGKTAPDLTRLAERMGHGFSHEYLVDIISGLRDVPAHGPREMPVWGQRFGESGPEAAAAFWMRRRLDALAAHVESLQVPAPPNGQR